MQLQAPAGSSRLFPTVLVALTMSVVTAIAAPKAVTKLNTKTFGNGVSLKATSEGSVTFSPQYNYVVEGTCEGTLDLKKVAKPGTSIATLLNSFSPGISAGLVGVVPPPVPPSKSSVLELPIKGARKIKGLGNVSFSALLRCEVPSSGKVTVEVTNVIVKNAGGLLKGVIRFGKGSVLTVSAPPRIVCKFSAQSVDENAGVVDVVISRNVNPSGDVKVFYTTVDGKAKKGVDYEETIGSFTIPSGMKQGTVSIPIIDNTVTNGGRRWFRLSLTSVEGGAYLGDKTQTNITIIDND